MVIINQVSKLTLLQNSTISGHLHGRVDLIVDMYNINLFQ